ncbi:heme lyase CcmF/NrfE family subunit [Vibrio europaeus]|uniref:heme lyase CcmF/NrfE family subunit n=1 Tax=Vibrio europaeus TaxID=300876 RepID=UPI00233F0597|nr:heme lyase CcmF/NrfE family subunit [Vibrio europaeus]MDC5803674.1 heme lyase CcmF/NrfE family subunit [Vibrio europaeus]MDC5823545.1 heme lyase CcmF/NrfE family subunit [Vibrio europaeus]MDC5828617.1 heme lyase CcmF/NrfE family subunit [Vibrio europaeus]MDC5833279.1 heme lyase CcmF/NrfE family subunit [Vibrio europaeus]
MVGELGHFALVWVAVSSSLISAVYAWNKWQQRSVVLSLSLLARLNGVVASLSLVLLGYLFVSDQFQFHYVASHSNTALPDFFKIAAVWGGHEGSMLFWVFTLAIWSACISFVQQTSKKYLDDVLWVMQLFIAAFGLFTLIASNPFSYAEVWLEQGRDLNPMLQDIGLIFHPPLLYLGYIGFSTVLAFALAALMQEKFVDDWVKLATPWAISAWAFLTLGILVGSWWAYNELGWGGWWFWDPVENASLLPWLTGTALLHALLAASRHQQQRRIALALALVTFSLSILGTFIVRSGVLTSVHAFAVDPGKGIALLAILAATLIGSFALLFERGEAIKSRHVQSLFGRSYLATASVGMLAVATFTVFLGTFYPMVYELVGLGSVSVGAPYFNTLFLPLVLLALMGMGLVPLLKWHKGSHYSKQQVILLFVTSMLVGTVMYWLQDMWFSLAVSVVWGLGAWVIISHLLLVVKQQKLTFMVLAHIGLAISSIGAVMNAEHSFEVNHKMEAGSTLEFGEWQVEYLDTHWVIGPNYSAEQAELRFSSEQRSFTLIPERRHYPVRVMNMSEPAIRPFWHGDYYVTLGSKVDADSYAVKIQYKAYISWIWGGALVAMLGAVLPFLSRRRKEVAHGFIKQA